MLLLLSLLMPWLAQAAPIQTNTLSIADAPSWLTASRAERVSDRIQSTLEWDIRKVTVVWYTDATKFQAVHGYGPSVLAFARKSDNSMHVGPKVTTENFDAVFGHELAHIISFQKYKGAIPAWLEEGLANYVARKGKVDYPALAAKPAVDVYALNHPFKGSSIDPNLHYQASTALAELLASKCSLADLLQLSVGKKLESFLSTYCGISDLNAEFKKWVSRKAR